MNTDKARTLFGKLIPQLEEIESVRDKNKLDAFIRRTNMLIELFFGAESGYLSDFGKISWHGYYDDSELDHVESWKTGWQQSNNLIKTIQEQIEISASLPKEIDQHSVRRVSTSNKIFIVHGHDDAMKQTVARVLEKLGLEPVILHEQANKGKTIIEKLSEHSDVSFSVVLLSPDDFGYSKEAGAEAAKPRARQNVVFELGLFIGKIGREAVVVLHPAIPDFEMPTDYSGIVFVPYDQYESWKYALIKELQAFGFHVDANDLTRPK